MVSGFKTALVMTDNNIKMAPVPLKANLHLLDGNDFWTGGGF